MRVAINGFGRIGKAIARINLQKKYFDLVAINDINYDNNNLAYQLKYDSTYGKLDHTIIGKDNHIEVDGDKIKVFHKDDINAVPWILAKPDIIIDASGIHQNVLNARKLYHKKIKHVIVTHSPNEKLIDKSIVMGVNEKCLSEDDFLISSSICDANAVAPTLSVLDKWFGVCHGFVTTLHPYLNYQNLLDGNAVSFGYPGTTYGRYELGRSSLNCLIPKPTSCIEATEKVLPEIKGRFSSMSFRVPTTIVSCADLSVKLENGATKDLIIEAFEKYIKKQNHKIFHLNDKPLISSDFTKNDHSAIVDKRWIQVNDDYVKMVVWYDNEWGYSHRVVDLVEYLEDLK